LDFFGKLSLRIVVGMFLPLMPLLEALLVLLWFGEELIRFFGLNLTQKRYHHSRVWFPSSYLGFSRRFLLDAPQLFSMALLDIWF
jgi:hypothetical protein